MRIFKTNPVLTLVNNYLIDNPEPTSISYLWNFGSLLGLCLVTQIITGILLAMHFQSSAELGFLSVEHLPLNNLIFYNENEDILNRKNNNILPNKYKDINKNKLFYINDSNEYFCE
jgi:Cytochrome b/b6/petB